MSNKTKLFFYLYTDVKCLKISFICVLRVVWKRLLKTASFFKVILNISLIQTKETLQKLCFISVLSVCKSQLLSFQEEPMSTPMHFSAGWLGVLELPMFQCSEPLGGLKHASPCMYPCTPGFYRQQAQLA